MLRLQLLSMNASLIFDQQEKMFQNSEFNCQYCCCCNFYVFFTGLMTQTLNPKSWKSRSLELATIGAFPVWPKSVFLSFLHWINGVSSKVWKSWTYLLGLATIRAFLAWPKSASLGFLHRIGGLNPKSWKSWILPAWVGEHQSIFSMTHECISRFSS
jgi:hypothetical protein